MHGWDVEGVVPIRLVGHGAHDQGGEEFVAIWRAEDVISVEADRYEGFVPYLDPATGWSKAEVCGRAGAFTQGFFMEPSPGYE
ncbi:MULTISPECIES: hypothetical protein [unclassified Streptomyces]|uniref:hypothetical protein n=1 Tax=unclassified Streptomyces TaxID=2593676 RepID=UPI002E2E2DC9|nr:hypothetical protein [Streptomyces sp. NBC_00273]